MASFPPTPGIVPPGNPSASTGRQRMNWVWPGLLMLAPIAALAFVLAHAASVYYLEIPMRTATPQSTRLFYWHQENKEGILGALVNLPPGPGTVRVRFSVGSEDVTALILDPTLGAGEIFVGSPVLRCAADDYLRYDVRYRDFKLSDLRPLHEIASATPENGFLHIVTKPGAQISICAIELSEPMRLSWSKSAFVRNFAPLALGWAVLALLLSFAVRRAVERWPGIRRAWPELARRLLTAGAADPPRVARWEKWAVIAIFVLVAAIQTNAVLHGGTKGQDYPTLYRIAERIAAHPERPWKFGAQDPPVFALTNAVLIWLVNDVHGQELCGAFNLLLNLAALWVFVLLTRRFLGDGVWRVGLLTLVAFLPFRLIHTVVLSGDALTLLPFFTLAWVLAAMTDESTPRPRRRWLTCAASLLLTLGVLTKYTFMSALVAVFLTLIQLARRRRIPWREAGLLLALALVLPIGVVVGQQREHPDFSAAMQFRWSGVPSMGVRDIVWPHARDAHIFRAPPYNESYSVERRWCNGKTWSYGPPYELLIDHQYSYLALNHLSIFTDPLNIFQYDPTDYYFGARNARNQRLMALAVKTALPITLACIAATALLSVLVIGAGLVAPARSRPDLEAVYLLGFGWFSNIIVFLPFIPPAYFGGYWTPRLTMSGLLLFLLFTVYVLARLLPAGRGRTTAAWLVLGYAVCQSALQIAFLLPWGKIYW